MVTPSVSCGQPIERVRFSARLAPGGYPEPPIGTSTSLNAARRDGILRFVPYVFQQPPEAGGDER
jgi:hypothetical protein